MRTIELTTPAGVASAVLYESDPPGGTSRASVVVVHEWWGLNESIRAVSERLHSEGFTVVAVDLYSGAVTNDPSAALKLASDMQTLDATAIIESAAVFLKQRAMSSGKVGVTGFCLGGAVTLAAACHCPSASAFVPFYGFPPGKYVDWAKTHGPIQGHYAEHDRIVDLARVRNAAATVNAAGGSFELHVYNANHAFMRADDSTAYNPAAASLAWQHAVGFLRRQLS